MQDQANRIPHLPAFLDFQLPVLCNRCCDLYIVVSALHLHASHAGPSLGMVPWTRVASAVMDAAPLKVQKAMLSSRLHAIGHQLAYKALIQEG